MYTVDITGCQCTLLISRELCVLSISLQAGGQCWYLRQPVYIVDINEGQCTLIISVMGVVHW